MKFINTPVDENLYRRFKVLAIEYDKTIEKLTEEALKDILTKYGKEEKTNE